MISQRPTTSGRLSRGVEDGARAASDGSPGGGAGVAGRSPGGRPKDFGRGRTCGTY